MARRLREVQPVEHLGRADAVERGIRRGEVDVEQTQRRLDVDGGEPGQVEAGAAGDEGGEVERRRARDPRERVGAPAGAHERVVVQRAQALERRVGSAQHRAQVVVLPEEGVEPPAHLPGLPVDVDRPRAHPSAEPLVALEQGDPDAALRECQRGGEPGDAAAHDDDVAGPGGHGIRAAVASGGDRWRVEDRPAVQTRTPPWRAASGDHDGDDPTTVWTTPCCHPA